MDFENQETVTWYEVRVNDEGILKMFKVTADKYDNAIIKYMKRYKKHHNVIHIYDQDADIAVCFRKPSPDEIEDIKYFLRARDDRYIGKTVYIYEFKDGKIVKNIDTIVDYRINGEVRFGDYDRQIDYLITNADQIDGRVRIRHKRRTRGIISFYEQDDYAKYAFAHYISKEIGELDRLRDRCLERIKKLDNEMSELNNYVNNIFNEKGE